MLPLDYFQLSLQLLYVFDHDFVVEFAIDAAPVSHVELLNDSAHLLSHTECDLCGCIHQSEVVHACTQETPQRTYLLDIGLVNRRHRFLVYQLDHTHGLVWLSVHTYLAHYQVP